MIDVEQGKDKEAVYLFAEKLEQRGGKKDKIEVVTSDMSKAYVAGIKELFPNAVNIIDKFHIKSFFIKALDEVRKEEQKEVGLKAKLFRGRHMFMIPKSKLTDAQAKIINDFSKMFKKTGKAYRIVASLDELYECKTLEEAIEAFDNLYSWMRRCRLKPMKDAAETFERHREGILAYFKHRQTNAICEAINSSIQAAKRRARGYPTFKGYKAMIYLIAGKLEIKTKSLF